MSLTEAVILQAPQITNACEEREIDLRGVGLKHLDELVLAKIADDFDCINLCDNQLTTLDAFPKMDRLTTLIMHKNNLLISVGAGVTVRAPNVHTFVANSCGFSTLSSLNFLAGWRKLQRVSFTKCPLYENLAQLLFTINTSNNGSLNGVELPAGLKGINGNVVVRLYIIAICNAFSSNGDGLKLIDFERVLDSERQQAKALKEDLLALPQLLVKMQQPSVVGVSAVSSSGAAASSSAPLYAADGTRIRKRGREATSGAAVGAAASSSSATDGDNAGVATTTSAAADPLDGITQEELDRRDNDLMERLNNATTDEEFAQIELEADILEKLKKDFAERQAKKSRAERR